jgi:hypothetical protein
VENALRAIRSAGLSLTDCGRPVLALAAQDLDPVPQRLVVHPELAADIAVEQPLSSTNAAAFRRNSSGYLL